MPMRYNSGQRPIGLLSQSCGCGIGFRPVSAASAIRFHSGEYTAHLVTSDRVPEL